MDVDTTFDDNPFNFNFSESLAMMPQPQLGVSRERQHIINALDENLNIQALLRKKCDEIDERLRQRKTLLRHLTNLSFRKSEYVNQKTITIRQSPPFFIDNEKEIPPDNPDTIARKGNSTQAPNLVYRKWISTEVEALEKEVLRENLRIHTDNGRLPITKTDGQLLKDITQLNWETIAFAIPGRTANECKIQWTVNKHPYINELPFKKQEVAKLKHVINKFGARDWIKIAREHGNGRVAAQCFRTYVSEIHQANVGKTWTIDEDQKLLSLIKQLGSNNLYEVSLHMNGRDISQCKHRSKTLMPNVKKGKWTAEEDDALIAAIGICGKLWKKVSLLVKTRTDGQCRERYENCLSPAVNKMCYTPEEDDRLIALIMENGAGNWSFLAERHGNGRTDDSIKRRYKVLLKSRKEVLENGKFTIASLSSTAAGSEEDDIDDVARMEEAHNARIKRIKVETQELQSTYMRNDVLKIKKSLLIEDRNKGEMVITPEPINVATIQGLQSVLHDTDIDLSQQPESIIDPDSFEVDDARAFLQLQERFRALFGWSMTAGQYSLYAHPIPENSSPTYENGKQLRVVSHKLSTHNSNTSSSNQKTASLLNRRKNSSCTTTSKPTFKRARSSCGDGIDHHVMNENRTLNTSIDALQTGKNARRSTRLLAAKNTSFSKEIE